MRDTSLVYPVRKDGRILLGHKRRGMGAGKWNGFGGKREDGETMRECADPKDFEAAGDLYFHQPSDPNWSHAGIVYFIRTWTGTVRLSDEMEPKWFLPEEIPFGEMWMADRIWLPMVLKGNKIRGTIYFEKDGSTVYDCHFEMV